MDRQEAVSIAFAVPHTPWVPERVRSFERLFDQLDIPHRPRAVATYRFFTERAANAVWSADMWRWGAEQQVSHFVTLQDDVIVAGFFWNAIGAMLEALPDQVIGLEVVHRAAPALAELGHRWFTTADCLIGVGYALPTKLLREFLEWRERKLKPGALEVLTEDTMLGIWCMVTGHLVFHPLPTIIDHDTGIASTYGNDGHANRRPLVRWAANQGEFASAELLSDPDWWHPGGTPHVHVGRFYDATPRLALEWVEGYGQAEFARDMRDNGRAAMRMLARARIAHLPEPKARLFVCTPTRGDVHPSYASTIAKLTSAPDLDVEPARFELDRLQHRNADVVRARSAFVREFLEETDATHLLFIDADVSFEPQLIRGMLAAGKDFIAAPYPSRGGVDWARAVRAGDFAEAAAYRYAIHLLDEKLDVQADGTAEIRHVGLGCTLLSRACLEQMTADYGSEWRKLVFQERSRGVAIPTVALFMLLLEDGELLSEDNSFCERWRRIGGHVHLYLGPGSPATHHGDHAFRGRIEAFGLKHEVG